MRKRILLVKIASLLKRAYPVTEQEALSCNGVTLHLESSKIEFTKGQAELTKNELYYITCLSTPGQSVPVLILWSIGVWAAVPLEKCLPDVKSTLAV